MRAGRQSLPGSSPLNSLGSRIEGGAGAHPPGAGPNIVRGRDSPQEKLVKGHLDSCVFCRLGHYMQWRGTGGDAKLSGHGLRARAPEGCWRLAAVDIGDKPRLASRTPEEAPKVGRIPLEQNWNKG